MSILLQHQRTQLYLQGVGVWTPNPHDSLDFLHARRAIDFARDHALLGVQIVMFSDHEDGGVLPLPARARPAAHHSKV